MTNAPDAGHIAARSNQSQPVEEVEMAKIRICSIESCGKKHFGKGFCESHYLRFRRNGDPVAGRASPTSKLGRCSVEGCNNAILSQKMCSAHYWRNYRHGSPLMGNSSPGEAIAFLNDVVLPFEGNDCLPWPYLRSEQGYGIVSLDGELRQVHRIVCERVNGAPPSDRHQAAHRLLGFSCGIFIFAVRSTSRR